MEKKSVVQPQESISNLCDWFKSPLGKEIVECEKALVDELVPWLFGYHLVQIGFDASICLFKASPVSNKIMTVPSLTLGVPQNSVIAQPHELPFLTNEIDVVILHHTLDFAEQPHQVLREAARILRPGGHLIIVGFNPASFWGICRRIRRAKSVPWSARGLSHWRLQDWLSLLELTEIKAKSGYNHPPLSSARWRKRFSFLESIIRKTPTHNGVVLTVLARKDVVGMTPLKPAWKRRALIAFPVAEPTTRESSGSRSMN